MKPLLFICLNLQHVANRRQVQQKIELIWTQIPFHSLVYMVDSEVNTFEEIETQDLSLEIKTFTDSKQTFKFNNLSQPSASQIHRNDSKKNETIKWVVSFVDDLNCR